MAGEERTIRVSGLPMDSSENRLIDKLQIHFLRKKNGGGEISSVTVSKTMPGTAFITFEESEVASRLAQRGKQVLKVSDKSYDITISLHHEEVDPDKVLLCMSVVVDHRKLPGGKNTLLSLHKRFSGVHLMFDEQNDLCTLKGPYSEVRSLSSLVLGSLEIQDQSSDDKPQPKTESKMAYNSPLEESANRNLGANEDTGLVKHTMQDDDLDLDLESEHFKTGLPSSYSDHGSHAALTEHKWAPDIGSSFEDFSLVVDSDIFRYLHKYCSKEYQSILKRHRVEVLDVNCDDITTLYFKPKTALSEHDISSVEKACQDLAHLHQQKESQLRKEHIYKHGIPEKKLRHALESLRKKLPKLMIDEEDRNVYMVGSKSDVSEAKQFIGDMQRLGMDKEMHSDHLFVPYQSECTFSKQGSSASSDLSGIFQPSFQDSHDAFMPKKDLEIANQSGITRENSSKKRQNSVEPKNSDDHSPTGQFTFLSQRIEKSAEDIFFLRRAEDSQERNVPSDLEWMGTGKCLDSNKYTDFVFDSSKPSAPILDINKKLFNKADFSSETTELQSHSDTGVIGSETQIKSNKGYKSKQTESGKERKMAANFSREMQSGIKDITSYKLEAPNFVEGTYVTERMFPDDGQPHSLPLIKPSMNSNLGPETLHSNASTNTSTYKMDIQELKSDMSKFGHFPHNKKPTVTLSCLSGDQKVQSFCTMPPGSTLRRSNSFTGSSKKSEEITQMAVDLSAEQKELSQNSQTRETAAMDLVLSFRLWLYLTSVYNTEIENLTSDLQVKEQLGKEDITLCLRSVDSKKVSECHHRLKSLIATAEVDFDTRTLPLSNFGIADCKDKILLELCTLIKQHHKLVKILVMSNDMMILGPKPLCDDVEAILIEVFHKGENIANLVNTKFPNPDSVQTNKAPDSDLKLSGDQSTTSAIPHANIITKNLSKMSNQSVHSSKKVPLVLTNQTRDNESGSQNKKKDEKLEQLDKKDSTLMQGNHGTTNNENSIINSTTKAKADGESNRDQTGTTAQRKETFIEQIDLGISVDQVKDSHWSSEVSEPKTDILPFHACGNQNVLLCSVCEKEYSTGKQAACGINFCPKCDKEVHNNCRTCATSGIKGTMAIQESTITISGFSRDTTLKIIYDIPDGTQGEDHPCPGAPFKGNRFEAFLPHNKSTKKLLPLLEKAFHKGLTFTVKLFSSDDNGSREGRVVWGSIPHKTRTEGGASNNGYPDFNYIKRLEEALKAAGVGE